MNLQLDVQTASLAPTIPDLNTLHAWATLALHEQLSEAELCIRIVDEAESQQLNNQYRGKDKPTNVLSFPLEMPGNDIPYLGDIIICAPIIEQEALAQEKPLAAHWAHMVIHGILHLLGYDHIEAADAEEMETLEINLLKQLGFANPYLHSLDKESHES